VERAEYLRLVFALEADAPALTTLYAWSDRYAVVLALWDTATAIAPAFAAANAASRDAAPAIPAAFARWYVDDARSRRAGARCNSWNRRRRRDIGLKQARGIVLSSDRGPDRKFPARFTPVSEPAGTQVPHSFQETRGEERQWLLSNIPR
jgi:hypothetical protein